jgi:glyoxylase-like metal-dependent hydrolase (beta-lactamase superfamily II)
LARATAATHPAEVADSADSFTFVTRAITDRVHLVFRPDPLRIQVEGNVTVIEQADGLVVIDAGGAPLSGERVVEQIRRLSDLPVKALVYTHYHGDHNLGAGAFLEAWPRLTIISTAKTRENMTGPPMKYVQTYGASYAGMVDYGKSRLADSTLTPEERAGWSLFVADGPGIVAAFAGMHPYPATMTFSDRLVLEDESAPVELACLGPANTDGDAVAWLPKQRVLVTGDIVVHPIPYGAGSYPREWIGVLRKLEEYDFAVLIPGHGEPQLDRAYLGHLVSGLEEVRRVVGPLVDQGLDLKGVLEKADFTRLRESFTGADAWRQFLFDNFFLNDIVKSAYKQAKGEPIVQGSGS